MICHQSKYFTISVEDISRNGWTWTHEEENLPLLTEHTSQFSSRLRHSITATPKIVEASLLVQICVRFTNAQIEANFTSKFRCHANVKRSQRYLIFSGAPAGAEGARGRSSIPIENGKSIKPRKFGGRPRPYVRPYVRAYVRTD